MNYKDIILSNKADFNDEETLIDFLDNYVSKDDDDVKDQEDNLTEYADGLVPIYYYDIIEEWKNNGDCHELTKEVCGEYGDTDIYRMMSSDLFFYYEQRLRKDYEKLLELLEDNA